jgi:hypothetical protein
MRGSLSGAGHYACQNGGLVPAAPAHEVISATIYRHQRGCLGIDRDLGH